MTWTTDQALRSGGRQFDGHHKRPAEEDDAFLDHHIEEVLGTFSDAARGRTSVDAEEQRLE